MANYFLTAGVRRAEGGFQQYTVCKASVVVRLPTNMPFKSGCVLPPALSTASMGLCPSNRLALPLPQPTKPKPIPKVLLVWGDSSSTGSAAIQLAVASGLTIVATASSKSHEFVKGLGATRVLDYRDERIKENLVTAIKETGFEFVGAVDAIGEEPTCRMCVEVTGALGGGKVATFMPQGIDSAPERVAVLGGKLKPSRSGSTEIDLQTCGY
jgi:NADPH:quinone reductase-like Zn-dependent oxidoreductase